MVKGSHVAVLGRNPDRGVCPLLGDYKLAAQARGFFKAGSLVEHVELLLIGCC